MFAPLETTLPSVASSTFSPWIPTSKKTIASFFYSLRLLIPIRAFLPSRLADKLSIRRRADPHSRTTFNMQSGSLAETDMKKSWCSASSNNGHFFTLSFMQIHASRQIDGFPARVPRFSSGIRGLIEVPFPPRGQESSRVSRRKRPLA